MIPSTSPSNAGNETLLFPYDFSRTIRPVSDIPRMLPSSPFINLNTPSLEPNRHFNEETPSMLHIADNETSLLPGILRPRPVRDLPQMLSSSSFINDNTPSLESNRDFNEATSSMLHIAGNETSLLPGILRPRPVRDLPQMLSSSSFINDNTPSLESNRDFNEATSSMLHIAGNETSLLPGILRPRPVRDLPQMLSSSSFINDNTPSLESNRRLREEIPPTLQIVPGYLSSPNTGNKKNRRAILLSPIQEATNTGNTPSPLCAHQSKRRKKKGSLSDLEKPWACGLCSASFSCLKDLGEHEEDHTSEKPFKCGICKKRFAEEEQLIAHKKGHQRKKSLIDERRSIQ